MIANIIMEDEDVLFQWSMFWTETEEAIGKKILTMMANLYITTRGFSFASSCVELYKNTHKKLLQKRKQSIR